MRDWSTSNPTFATALAGLDALPFWSVVVRFVAGDFWIAARENDAGGIDHAVIMVELAGMGSTTGRSEPMQLDVAGTDLNFVNIPKHADMPGPLATGERFLDRWVRTLESVLADVYLNFETSPGTFVREKMLAAVCSSPSSAGYLVGSLHLASRTERYLNASVLRKIQSTLYPFARTEDINATVPIVIGAAPKSPGRIVKAGKTSIPVAGPDNTSSATLLPPAINSDVAIAESFTVEFSDTETAEFVGTTDGETDIGLTGNSGSTEPVAAQSFTIADGQRARGITFKCKSSGNLAPRNYCTVCFEIWSDSGGSPGSLVSVDCRIITSVFANATAAVQGRYFANPPDLAPGTYWLVARQSPGGHQAIAGHPWGELVSLKTQWSKASGGGYAGGTAKKGTHPRHTYATAPAFRDYDVSGEMTWDTALNGQDFYFRIAFQTDTYTVTGSVTGFDGNGTTGELFVSDSGAVTIASDRWQGLPSSGDTFTFLTDPAEAQVIFSESPAATGVSAILAVYFDDVRIASGTTVSQSVAAGDAAYNAPWGTLTYLTLGEDAPAQTATPPPYEYGNEWQGVFWPIDVEGTQTFRRIGWQVWHAAPVGTQANPLRFSLYGEAQTVGSYRVPDRNKRFVSVDVDQSLVSISDGYSFVYADIPPTTVTDRRIYVAIETEQFSENDFYELRFTNYPAGVGAPGVGVLRNHNGAFYVGHSFKPGVALIGGTVTTELQADDGTGNFVARALFDFDIPDDVQKVTADIAGISDNISGDYTGTPGAVLTLPSQIFHWLLNRSGVDDSDIDLDGTFLSAASFYSSSGYRFDGVIQDATTFKTLLLKLAYECRSAFDWIVQATLRVLAAELDEAVETITLDDILPDSDKVPVLRLERSPDSELINSLIANFNRVLAGTTYKSTISRHVPTSIVDFGVLERDDLQALDFVRVAAMAQDVIDLRLARQAFPFWRISLTTLLPFLALEKDDPVALDLTNAAEAGEALGGWDGSQVLLVEGLMVQPELPGLDLVLREVNLDVEIADGDGYAAELSIVVLLDQGDLVTVWDYVMGYPPHGRWTAPSTSGGTQYDGIGLDGPPLLGPYVLVINNGIRNLLSGATATAFAGSVFTWVGPPAARVEQDADGDLIVMIDF